MRVFRRWSFAAAWALSVGPLGAVEPPAPYGPVPSAAQLAWHELEFYGFLHFTVNTFTDKEWGYGDEKPEVFQPTDFDADQIARVAKKAGMKGLILTAKHHDGFCLWPSKFTEHSVKASPWRGGGGDVVREIERACRRHGLAFGVYLSPWDRNHPEYGRAAYVAYYRDQLRELLTEYGPIFEVWFDGANGGDGYYGGARETRRIDPSSYYGWETTWALVRALQPPAVMFSDVGPDIRWVGNERGEAGDPCWARYTPRSRDGRPPAPGHVRYEEGFHGHREGERWLPAEVDVSIRPGWFYHPSEDDRVRSPENLLELYYRSVGRGASLLLNVPPDRRGRIHERDEASLEAFGRLLEATFSVDLARGARARASNVRGRHPRFGAQRALDGDRSTYWSTDDGVTSAELILEFDGAIEFDVASIREHLPLGQRVHAWALDRWDGGGWAEIAKGESIGSRRLWRGPLQRTSRVRLRVEGPVPPAISEFALHAQPRSGASETTHPPTRRD